MINISHEMFSFYQMKYCFLKVRYRPLNLGLFMQHIRPSYIVGHGAELNELLPASKNSLK